MFVEDLMVKNWVSYKNIPHSIKKFIGHDVVLDKPGCSSDEDYIIAKAIDCQPIELTGEILVECGFLEAKDKYVLDYGTIMLLLAYDKENEAYNLSIGLCNMQVPVKYVHQLQQILKAHGYVVKFDLNKNNCDYRKGNWVEYNGSNYCVDDFNKETGEFMLKPQESTLCTVTVLLGDFKPITIDTNIVLVNKFVKTEDDAYMKTDESGEKYSILFAKDSVWNIVNKVSGNSYEGYIQHFNQLQNICSMLEIEVELKPYSEMVEINEMLDAVFK